MTTTPTIPAWLTRQLIAAGHLTTQGLTRRAKILRHPPCRTPCLAGLDARLAALDAWCDLTEISALGEAHALLDHRTTYELWNARTDRPELETRDPWRIRAHPAGHPTTGPILATHRCHQPIPATWRQPPTPQPPSHPPATHDRPGF